MRKNNLFNVKHNSNVQSYAWRCNFAKKALNCMIGFIIFDWTVMQHFLQQKSQLLALLHAQAIAAICLFSAQLCLWAS